MSFDNGIALGNTLFVLTIGLYPIAVLTCSVIAWFLHVKMKLHRASILVNLVPMLWIVGFAMFILIF